MGEQFLTAVRIMKIIILGSLFLLASGAKLDNLSGVNQGEQHLARTPNNNLVHIRYGTDQSHHASGIHQSNSQSLFSTNQNRYSSQNQLRDRNQFSSQNQFNNRNQFSSQSQLNNRNQFSAQNQQSSNNQFFNQNQQSNRPQFFNQNQQYNRNQYSSQNQQYNRNQYSSQNQENNRN